MAKIDKFCDQRVIYISSMLITNLDVTLVDQDGKLQFGFATILRGQNQLLDGDLIWLDCVWLQGETFLSLRKGKTMVANIDEFTKTIFSLKNTDCSDFA